MNRAVLKKHTVSLLYPNRCRFCARVIDIRETACESCQNSKNEITGDICKACGCEKSECVCRGQIHFYKAVAAPYYYDGAAGKAIRIFKFQKRKEYAEPLYEDMARCLNERFGGYSFDLITFVPSAKKAEKQRGFNQSRILAEGVSRLSGIPFAELLKKDFETAPQHMLPENERSGNLLGVFTAVAGTDVTDMRILLCDDIKTTGATLNECAKTLLIAGAAEVFCLTAAVTRRKDNNSNSPEE